MNLTNLLRGRRHRVQVDEIIRGDEHQRRPSLLAGPTEVISPVASSVPRPRRECRRHVGTPVHGIDSPNVANERLKDALRRARRRRQPKRPKARRDRVARGEHRTLRAFVVVERREGAVPHGVPELGRIVGVGVGPVDARDSERDPNVTPVLGVKDVE